MLLVAAARGRLPRRVEPWDLFLLGVATHKLSRLITKDFVTSALRAPFTTLEQSAGTGEVNESPRGTGLRKALGELLSCPWCTGQWVAAALLAGHVAAPRATRLVATAFSAVALSDFLHLAYEQAKRVTGQGGNA